MISSTTAAGISARIDRIPANRKLWTWVAKLSLGGFFEVYDLALTALMSPLLVQAGLFRNDATGMFGVSDQATFAFATMFGLYVGALGFSNITDKYSRRSLFVGSMLWYSMATVMMGLQDTAIGICFWRFIAGVGLGVELVVIDCYLAEITPKALRGRVFSISKFLQLCAIPVSGLLAHFVAPHDLLGVAGWRWMALFPAVGALIVLAIRRNIPESPRWLASKGKLGQADNVVRNMEEYVTRRMGIFLAEPALVPEVAQKSVSYRDLFRAPYLGRVAMLIVATSASSIAYYGFAQWTPTLLENQGVSVTKSLLYAAMIGFAYPLSPLIAATFADRVERKWQIVIGGAIVAVSGLLFAWQTTAVMWIAMGVFLTFGNELKGTATHTYRAELFPTELRGKAVGFVYSFSRLASAVSSYLIAFVLLQFGVQGVFITLALFIGLSIFVTLMYGPRTLGLAYEELEKGRARN
ncbi:MAG TPA: MFS transporter [Usitatibacteraceae bacterium]